MICSKCTHWKPATINVRMTPTFYHSPIFDPYEHTRPSTRCSATYHSTVFDGAKIHRQVKCCCKKVRQIGQQKVSKSRNKTRKQTAIRCNSVGQMKRQAKLNREARQDLSRLTSRGISHHKLLWCNPDKEVQLMNCSNCYQHGLSRERKLIQLSSNPFYPQLQQMNTIISSGCQHMNKSSYCCPQCRHPQNCNYQCWLPECCCQKGQQKMVIENPQINDNLDTRNENYEQNKERVTVEEETTFGKKQSCKPTASIVRQKEEDINVKANQYGKTVKKNKNEKKGEGKIRTAAKGQLNRK